MVHIYSTLTAAQNYNIWVRTGNDLHTKMKAIHINGGHGIPNKHLLTPRGVATTISDEDYEHLLTNPTFTAHVRNGYIQVEKKAVDSEKAAANLKDGDESAQLKPQDFDEDNVPVTADGGKGGRKKG